MNERVNIQPLPASLRDVPPEWWPNTPPVRISGPEDRELAFELFEALDPMSQDWYRSRCSMFAAS